LYLACATAARQTETFLVARKVLDHTTLHNQNIFLLPPTNDPVSFFKTDLRERLLMVGPCSSEWNVLRDTDGERFVRSSKAAIFMENL
jgi:hypothetical protein